MPPPNTIPVEQEVLLVTLLLCRPCQLLRQDFVDITRELHGPGYYHIGSRTDQGYAEHMRAMFGRDDMDPP